MDQGELLGDDLIMEMVAERLEREATSGPGASCSTAAPGRSTRPRCLADILDPTDIDLRRRHRDAHPPGAPPAGGPAGLRGLRRQLLDCPQPPMINWTCDVCGGEVVQRDDDTEAAITRRLELYEHQTAPLIEWYAKRGPAGEVHGTGAPDAVTRRMVRAVEDHRDRQGRERVPGEAQRRRAGQDAQGRPGGGRDARGHPGRPAPGGDDRRHRPGGPRGHRAPGRHLQLPRLPRVPGGGLHLAQLDDRPRHPLRATCPRGRRHHLDRLRRHHRGVPRRRRLHRRASARSSPRPSG